MLATIATQANKSRQANIFQVQLDMIEVQVAAMQSMEQTQQIIGLLERLIVEYHAIHECLSTVT